MTDKEKENPQRLSDLLKSHSLRRKTQDLNLWGFPKFGLMTLSSLWPYSWAPNPSVMLRLPGSFSCTTHLFRSNIILRAIFQISSPTIPQGSERFAQQLTNPEPTVTKPPGQVSTNPSKVPLRNPNYGPKFSLREDDKRFNHLKQ